MLLYFVWGEMFLHPSTLITSWDVAGQREYSTCKPTFYVNFGHSLIYMNELLYIEMAMPSMKMFVNVPLNSLNHVEDPSVICV